MTDDLLRTFAFSWPEAASAVALALSGAALFVAQRLSHEAQRKVDGMLGELSPLEASLASRPGPRCSRKKASTSALSSLWNAMRSKPGPSVQNSGKAAWRGEQGARKAKWAESGPSR